MNRKIATSLVGPVDADHVFREIGQRRFALVGRVACQKQFSGESVISSDHNEVDNVILQIDHEVDSVITSINDEVDNVILPSNNELDCHFVEK